MAEKRLGLREKGKDEKSFLPCIDTITAPSVELMLDIHRATLLYRFVLTSHHATLWATFDSPCDSIGFSSSNQRQILLAPGRSLGLRLIRFPLVQKSVSEGSVSNLQHVNLYT